MKIGIITAMQVEHDQIAALLTDCAELPAPTFGAPPVLTGRLGDHTVVLLEVTAFADHTDAAPPAALHRNLFHGLRAL